MYLSKSMRRLCSLLMALVMLAALLPLSAVAAEDSVVVIAASDFQLSNASTIMKNTMNRIKADYGSAYGLLMGGDYDGGSVSTKPSHIETVDNAVSSVFPEIPAANRLYLQGNHENYAGMKPGTGNLLVRENVNDTAYYGVYAINHDDFPWTTSSNPRPSQSLVQGTADDLGDYLEAKIAEGYTKPIFVMSHLPLHATTRGDNQYAKLIFDELEAAGEAGLNIIFLVGHNHSGGYDAYLGNGSFYLPVGSSLTVVEGTSGKYTDDSISFTYMNYGYLGKISGGACTHQTMTAFEITGDRVTVKRYDEKGTHTLKAAGASVSGFKTDSSVIGTEGAVIELGEPVPVETVTQGNVSVSAAGLTGLTVTKTQSTADGKHDAQVYSAYASYDIVPQGYEQGSTATVTITLDTADGFDAAKAVYVIDEEKGTETKAQILNGAVTFTTNHFSEYSIAQKITRTGTYELATSIEAGESYVIVGNDDPVALMDNDGSLESLEVTISGDVLTSEEELTLWTFSSASSGTVTSGNGNKLGYSSSSWNLTGSGDCTFDFGTGNNNVSMRVIRASSGYNRYYFYYDGSEWAKNSSSSASYVRLYKLAEGGSPVEPEVPETPDVPVVPEAPEEGQWIALPAGNTYVLDTNGIDNGAKYLIVAESYDKALREATSGNNGADISIDGDTATADAEYGWTFSGSGSSWRISKDGTYLSRSNSNLSASNSAASWTVSNSGSGSYTISQSSGSSWWWGSSDYYVRWSNSNNRFQASNSNNDSVRLYKHTGSGSSIGANYIRLGGMTEQEYTTLDEAALADVLGRLEIQTSSDGVNTDAASLEVTADMAVWNVAFDGKTPGTYTATVTCDGFVLGTVTVTVTAAEHNFETVTVAATCTEDGSVTTKCTICGEETVEVIPATGHSYECVVTDATCGAEGVKTYTCSACGDSYTETISATGKHTYETVTVEATCTENGTVTTKCTVCGDETVEVIEAKGHDYDCVITDATCGAEGVKTYTCSACGDSYTETIPATGKHSYETVTLEPTCTEAGSVTYTCSGCGHNYAQGIAALGHSFASVVTPATCTEAGYTTYTCTTCGHTYQDDAVPAFGHTYGSVITATCTQDGYVVYTCKTCGHSYNGEAVAAFGHSYESTTVAPGCDTTGYTTYVCTTCGHTYTGDETAALGHDYDSVITEATCTEAGYTDYTCTVCGHSYVGDHVDALGHAYESVVTAPTFETEGYTTHTCTVCGDVKVDSFVPVLRHTYETVTTEATCTEDGSVVHTCVECGYSYTEILPALGHNLHTVTTEATCTVNGSIVTTCSVCGEKTVEVIAATGHSYEITTIDPTCTEAGYTTYTCACGHVHTEEIAATGHSYESSYTAPTCTENGGTTYTCACGDVYTEVVPATGHSYQSVSVAPTCTESGYTTYTCAVCSHSYTADETAALGHSYNAAVTAPTCTEGGYTTYVCGVCGHSYTADKTAALGHSYSSTVTAPTCTEGGYTTYVCDVCAHSYTGSQTAALGHSYSVAESDGYLVYTCDDCGHSYSEKIEDLTYTRVSSISSDNRYVITLYSGRKYYALSHKNNTISLERINVSGKEITSEITEDLIWDYDNSKLSYTDNGRTYYLYAQPAGGWWGWWSAPTLTLSTYNSTNVSFRNNQLKLGSYYLSYSGGKAVLNLSATTTYCFVEE